MLLTTLPIFVIIGNVKGGRGFKMKLTSVLIKYSDKITGRKHIAVGFFDEKSKKTISVFRPNGSKIAR